MADEEKELQSQEAPAEGSRGEHGEKQRPARRTRTPKKEEAPGPHDTLEDLPGELARAVERIRAGLPGVEVRGRRDHWLEIRTEPSRWVEVATFLRDDPELRFDYLALLTGIDRLDDGFEVVVHLNALTSNLRLILRTQVPREEPVCPTLTGVWPGANWHEREAYDLLGIRFEGHPDLRRILLKEDWVGHPLRKDYIDRRPPRKIQVKADWERRA
ncbi:MULTISPECIES: NADH-quinone oxidoreductase subunit C [Limnochorda]|uniref:NADH-quinone oxidoreductase subunit C n=1 Tax=Limnochorda TaxID=1676651 RepID=UPI001805AEFE|nr:NADH-quinone oxidoreductase subunit C [Limnochorda pilosa]MBO2486335.1 NADH-quinone oxidoreductase subunit C [Bacillota bacterium]MBO2518812.1 NADH-quinone oxidoreductase subunit C [Bacillota bacterium]NMA72143.1 NADH-quinone oxidoreductase subunit C [Bacillota bacterium]